MWLPALAAASIIKVIMAGQRVDSQRAAVTPVTPRCSRRKRTFTPAWRCVNSGPAGPPCSRRIHG